MKKINFILISLFFLLSCQSKPTSLSAQPVPNWITNLEQAYPSRDWIAVTAEGATQTQAETAAMNALARAFKTDIASITHSSQQFSEIIDNSKKITFTESKNFSQEVNLNTNIKGLIGVQINTYTAPNKTVHVIARMNRRECAPRYSGMIRENAAIIDAQLTATANAPRTTALDAYIRLNFAHTIAQITDNFQNILEVLDPTAVNRKPAYGGANAIKAKMLDCAALITIGVAIDTEQPEDKIFLTRAAGSFFRDLGFRTSEQDPAAKTIIGNYLLRANVRFVIVQQSVVSCRYYLDTALENHNGAAVFTYTEEDRKAHTDNPAEARRFALRAVETSFKEGKFAQEFNTWLNSFLY
jgi:hypothetical protein